MKHTLVLTRNALATVTILLLGLAAANGYAADAAAPTNAVSQDKTGNLPVVSVKDYLHAPESYLGREIVLQGFVTDVCRRKGCWALLHDKDADDKGLVRVKQNEEGDTFKAFLPELQGQTIQVTGSVKETKIDKDYLDQWEARVRAAREKAVKANDQKSEAGDSYDAVLKQIAGLRERLAGAKHGYLSSYSFAVAKWEALGKQP
jgi:hypothetical protein